MVFAVFATRLTSRHSLTFPPRPPCIFNIICKLSTAAHLSPMQSEFWKLLDRSSRYFRLNVPKLMVQKKVSSFKWKPLLPRAFDKSTVKMAVTSPFGSHRVPSPYRPCTANKWKLYIYTARWKRIWILWSSVRKTKPNRWKIVLIYTNIMLIAVVTDTRSPNNNI